MLNARTLAPEHILNPLQWRVSGNWPNRASVLLSFHFVSWNHWLCRYFNIDCSPSLTNFYELCAGKKEKFLLVTGFHQQETIFVTNCGWKHTIVKDPNMKNQWLIWPNIYLIADWYLYLLCWEPWLKQAPAATDHCTCQVVTATGPGSPVLGSCLWWELLASSLHDVDVQIQQEASTPNVEEGSASCVQHSSGSVRGAVHHCIGPSDQWCHENLIRVTTGSR